MEYSYRRFYLANDDLKEFKGQTIYASEYYYGCQPGHWDEMLYPDAIIDRRNKAYKIYTYYVDRQFAEYKSDFNGTKLTTEELRRMSSVSDAYVLNKKLHDEKTLVI